MDLKKYKVLQPKVTRRALMKNDSSSNNKHYYSKVTALTNTKLLEMRGMSASVQRDWSKDSKMKRIFF
jgi:hypothetical protein